MVVGNQAVVSSFSVPPNNQYLNHHDDTVIVEGKSQVYSADCAEQCRVGIAINCIERTSKYCALPSEDHLIIYNYGDSVVSIDKKRLTLQHTHNNHIMVTQLDKHLDKIILTDTIGSVDCDGTVVVMIANGKCDQKCRDYCEPLGEQLEEWTNPVMMIIKLADMTVTVVDLGTLCPLKALLAADKKSIFFMAVDRKEPRGLGLVYCSNKPVGLYKITVDTMTSVKCIIDDVAIRSLIVNKSRTRFIYLSTERGGAHFKPCAVCEYDTERDQSTVIAENVMVGSVFGMGVPSQQYDQVVYATIQERFYGRIAKIDVLSGNISILTPNGQSWSVLCVVDGHVVAQKSSTLAPPSLHVIDKFDHIYSVWGDNQGEPSGRESVEIVHIHPHCEALLITPASGQCECIMMPHGGPNSNYVDEYAPLLAEFLNRGYSICKVNYTGSTGYSAQSIDRLIRDGQVGIADVQDCKAVADLLLSQYKFSKLFFYGGSHGGYLGAMLTSQYPRLFAKACLINPVISMWANAVDCDIMDYVWHNLGLPYDYSCPTADELMLMWTRSPHIIHSNSTAVCETLIIVGGKDKRVPPRGNGVAWWGWLRRAGCPVRCVMFEQGGHALTGTPEMERDVRIAILDFIQ